MDKLTGTKSGFTLVEVLLSVGIMLVFLPFAANMLTNSQLLASYSKHKIQAAYAAQQILETQRQSPFVVLPAGGSKVIGPSNVILDTKGNYNNLNCITNTNIFCGNSVITVTPTVYTSNAGIKSTSTTVDHVMVQVYWSERIFKLMVPMTETYAEDIANDPMLN
jgi:prepilin-type N-terminal cleavage/methylation domain-containing protein